MNFETKYLIRWGIPGWIFLLALTPYVSIVYGSQIISVFSNKYLLVLGTFVTLAGVPLGYFFNQLHHLFGWVLCKKIKGEWNDYFEQEIKVDNILAKEKNAHYKERYRYLLTKKHEVGSVLCSFIGTFIIVLFDSISPKVPIFNLAYLFIMLILIGAWTILRNYASKNIEKYFYELLKASEE